ncbi:hypothetical protein RND61_32080 [Streptomyces sp. TRM76323]|uniref:Uncharacterized protein n=1 Tax=Streptomyces tamarix TaxID=3078565 RepID=A0ABU3QVQ3_9ACTN|nr:hypothetical protein [Streptomyces tamarix]MDT9686668.1 hypothetical protein [Streptomyces tamarix]
MHTRLRDLAEELAAVLWREHTLYRERSGGVVIRGEHVRRWISLSPRGTRDDVLIRAGRILDGGTTAPARSEVVVSLSAGRDELAAVCRRLLAEAAADAEPSAAARAEPARAGGRAGRRAGRGGAPAGRTGASRSGKGRSRHTGLTSWVVLLGVMALVGVYAYHASAAYR